MMDDQCLKIYQEFDNLSTPSWVNHLSPEAKKLEYLIKKVEEVRKLLEPFRSNTLCLSPTLDTYFYDLTSNCPRTAGCSGCFLYDSKRRHPVSPENETTCLLLWVRAFVGQEFPSREGLIKALDNLLELSYTALEKVR